MILAISIFDKVDPKILDAFSDAEFKIRFTSIACIQCNFDTKMLTQPYTKIVEMSWVVNKET